MPGRPPQKQRARRPPAPVYAETEVGPVELPGSARTPRQRVEFLLRRGYVWGAYMLARHSNKVLVGLLRLTNPATPWKNLHYAARHSA